MVLTGALTSIHFGWERYFNGSIWTGTYGTAATTLDKVFGEGQKISGLERSNNLERIFALGRRSAVNIQPLAFTGTFSIECALANPYIFRAILGNAGTVNEIEVTTPGTTTSSAATVAGDMVVAVADVTNFLANDWVRYQTDASNNEYFQIESFDGSNIYSKSPFIFAHPSADTVQEWSTDGTSWYDHVFTELTEAPSITIQNSLNLSTDQKILYKGCVVTGATISCNVDEVVNLKVDFEYADEILSATSYITQTNESEDMYSFAHGSLKKLVAGVWTTLGVVQSCEISINTNAEILRGLGARTGVERAGKQFEYDITASIAFASVADFQELFYTGVASATAPGTNITDFAIELDIDNGKTTTSIRNCIISIGGIKIDTDSLPQDPTAVVMEDISMQGTTMMVVARNQTSAVP